LSQGEKPASIAEELSKKLDQIIRRLDLLEKLILEKPEYEGLATAPHLTRAGMGMYGEPLKVASRLKSAERCLHQMQTNIAPFRNYLLFSSSQRVSPLRSVFFSFILAF